jgi:hypothetical protein
MGQAKLKRSATQRFLAQYPDCCFCGGARQATTREHMPPKALFDSSHRPDKLVMPACRECNGGTSTADLVASVVSRWGYDTDPQRHADHSRLIGQVRRQAPDLISEWTKPIDRAKARQHLEDYGVRVPPDAGLATIGPLTIAQLNLFAHKVVLGLYFEHFHKLLSNTGRFCAFWRSKEDFAQAGVPTVLLGMMQKYGTLEQGKWNVSEVFEYRFEINEVDGLFACLARLRGALFVCGFVASDVNQIAEDEDAEDWIQPSALLSILSNPAFQKRK